MNDDNVLGAALGQVGQAVGQVVKKTGQQAIKISEEVVKDAGKQIVGQRKEEKPQENKKYGYYWKSDEERIEYLRHLYGSAEQKDSSGKKSNNPVQSKNIVSSKDKAPSEFEKQITDKSPD